MAKFIYDTDGMVALEKDLVTIHDEIKEEIEAIETQLEELNKSRASLEASKTVAENTPVATVNTIGMSAEQARAAAESVAHANRVRAERIASLAREISAVDAQIVELQSVLDEIIEDMELLLSVIQSVRDVVVRVDDVEAEAVSFVLRQLVNLELLSKASIKVATSVMDAVHSNSEACTGARYVESICNGEKVRVYTDMYADLGDEAQKAYEALARVIGLNATIAVMDANGETLDLAYNVAFMVNEGVVNKEEIKRIYNANKFKVNNVDVTDMFSDKYANVFNLQDNYTPEKLSEIGIDMSLIRMNVNSAVQTSDVVEAQAYTVVSNDSQLAGTAGYFTEYEYNMLIAQVAHEGGSYGVSDCFGLASAILNSNENNYDGDMVECIKNECIKYESDADPLYENYFDPNTGELLAYDDDHVNSINNAKAAVDVALSGVRAFDQSVQHWVGNWNYLAENNISFSHAHNRFSTTHLENDNFV